MLAKKEAEHGNCCWLKDGRRHQCAGGSGPCARIGWYQRMGCWKQKDPTCANAKSGSCKSKQKLARKRSHKRFPMVGLRDCHCGGATKKNGMMAGASSRVFLVGWEWIRDAAQDLERSMYSFGHAFLKGWAWAEVVAKTEGVWRGYQVRGNQSNLAFSAQSGGWVGEMTIVNAEEEGEMLKKCWYKNRQAEMGG